MPELRAQSTITTLAGTEYVFNGDGKSGLDAPIGRVASVTLDLGGNPVFSDPNNCVVLRLNPNGTVTVLAGNGILGFSGDGGPATTAALNTPQGIAYDTAGNLYIADSGNNRVRKVTPGGIISTVAGNGISRYSGDGGPATQASLTSPLSLAVDSSTMTIYIGDLVQTSSVYATRIRQVGSDGIITTIAGTGQVPNSFAPVAAPGKQAKSVPLADVEDIALDSKGNLYLAEFGAHKIEKIDASGNLSTFAGDGVARYAGDGGAATQASFYNPGGVTVDSAGNVYISDTNNSVIRKVNSQGIVNTIAGIAGVVGFSGDGASALNARFNGPFGLVVDSGGNVLVTDTENFRVRKIRTTGNITTLAGNGLFRYFPDGTPAALALLFQPYGVSTDPNGNIYVADTENCSIRKITRNGVISTIAGNGTREYSGDGGPAIAATLNDPINVTSDSQGNLYIADSDNEVIRKITPDGNISTVAGNGSMGFSGDGGPAAKASLNTPTDVVSDNKGNLYISDFVNDRIRRVAPDGTITTFAGNPSNSSLGDNGPAAQASLSGPRGLAFDSNGNLYVVDFGHSRIRKISTSGMITTFAGGGSRQVSNVAIPATQAQIQSPLGIVLDGAGNLYLSDATTNRVYQVSASTGNITVVAGNGNYGFSGDGGPATLASLAFPYGLALDATGNLLIADFRNNRIRTILSAPPTLTSSPTALSFTAKSGGSLTNAQNLSVNSSIPGLLYTLSTTTTNGGPWLKANVANGTVPATIQVQADPTGLDPGTYQGTVTITSPNASPATRAVSVTLTVQASDPPQLGVGSTFLTFAVVQGAAPSTQTLSILNQGGGSLHFTANALIDGRAIRNGDFSANPPTQSTAGWLSVTPVTGAATPVQSSQLTVQADPTGLDPGTYSGSILITPDTGAPVNVPVTLTISKVTRSLLLSQVGLQFNAAFGGGAPLPQTFAVINSGQGDLNWTVKTNTLSGGTNWLSASPSGGTSTAGATVPPSVSVSIDASNLAPGEYYGQIQVLSGDANNSPQSVTVVLDVLATGVDPGPEVRPTGLVFTGVSGTSPGSQAVSVSNLSANTFSYASGRVTQDGANWFVNAPTNDTVPPGQPVRVVVQPDFTNLAPGTYTGALTLLFNSSVVRTVNVLSIVTAGPSSQSSQEVAHALTGVHDAGGCTPKSINLQFMRPDTSTTPKATQPVSMQVSANDNCGTPMTTGSVTVKFSNHDPDVNASHVGNGVWEATWQPRSANPSQVTMQATAFQAVSNAGIIGGQVSLTVNLISGTTPFVNSGVLNSASLLQDPSSNVAPGGLITFKGSNLADGTNFAPGTPYGMQLGNSQVYLDASPLALLYAADGQINAQVPYDLSVNAPHQLIVQHSNALSVPINVTVALAQPAIFTLSGDGTGQGYIYAVRADQTESYADVNAPATAGDTIDILCTGLGVVAPSIGVGQAPSGSIQAVNPVSVSIGGVPASFQYATLYTAGGYQVRVTVPQGVPAGNAVPVVLTVGNQSSPATATMAIH